MKIVYKVLGCLLSLAIFPVAIFAPFVKVVVSSSALSMFSCGDSTSILLNETYSLYDLYNLFKTMSETGEGGLSLSILFHSIPESIIETVGTAFVFFLIFFALALITALVLFFVVIFNKKKKAIIITAGLGLIFTLAMNIAFNKFASPIITGIVPITDLLTGSDLLSQLLGGSLASIGSLLQSLLGSSSSLVSVNTLSLSTAYILMLLVYAGSMALSGIQSITDRD